MLTIPSFDLKLLPVLVAVHEERSVTLAARRLGVSQSAVSKALARLRTALRDQLFVKNGRGMEPTIRATSLIGPARDVLERVQRNILSEKTFHPAITAMTINFAISEIAELLFLPKLLERLQTLAPRAVVASLLPPAEVLSQGLESGAIDLAMGVYPELPKNNFFRQRLVVTEQACLLRADHPIRGNHLPLKQYLALGHVVVRGGHTARVAVRISGIGNLQREVALVISHYLGLPNVIEHTDLVATIARPLADYFARMNTNLKVVTPPPEIPPASLQQYWHRKFHDDAKNKWLRGLVKELFDKQIPESLDRKAEFIHIGRSG